jgi:FkbM family methyltransferase
VGAFGTQQQWGHYWRELAAYRSEAASAGDLARLLRVRLALSKVGRFVCARPITVTVALRSLGTVVLRSHSTDVAVLSEIVVANVYRPVLELVRRPVRTIVDLGANTGLTARWFDHHFHPQQLVCVEPEPGNATILRANVAGVAEAVVLQDCIGGHRRRVELDISKGDFAVRMVDLDDAGEGSVDVVTMDDVIELAGAGSIDLLKCDIEGAERELFADCASWIGRVGAIVVECHGGSSVDHLLADLERNGATFEVRHFEPNRAYDNEVAVLCRTRSRVLA